MANFDQILKDVVFEIKQIKNKDFEPTSSLMKSGFIDSLALLDLIVALEDKFSISISAADARVENFDTPEQIAQLILRKLS